MKGAGLIPIAVLVFLGCEENVPVGHWQWAGGPYAQNVSALLVDHTDTSHVFAGLFSGEVFHSTDHGISWASLSLISERNETFRFIQHPVDPRTVFAATSSGLFKSSDGCATWSRVRIIPDVTNVQSVRVLAIDPFRPSDMYTAIPGKGFHRSTDGGMTWKQSNAGLPDTAIATGVVHALVIDGSTPDHLYAAIKGFGVVRSTNRGKTWAVMSIEPSLKPRDATSVLITHQTSAIVVGFANGNILRSADRGSTWRATRSGYIEGFVTSMGFTRSDGVMYAGTESGLIRSMDKGATWEITNSVTGPIPTNVACFDSRGGSSAYVFGEGIGVFSLIGGVWEHRDRDLGGARVSFLNSDRSGSTLLAVVGGSIHLYDWSQGFWRSSCNGLSGKTIASVALMADSSHMMYAGGTDAIYRSRNGGAVWDATSRTLLTLPLHFMDSHPLIRTRLYAAGDAGLHISTNGGTTWQLVKPTTNTFQVRSMTFSPTNAGGLYAATRTSAVQAATDGGFNWNPARYGITSENILAVTLDPEGKNGAFAWAADGRGFRTTDGGISWSTYTVPWETGVPLLIAMDRFKPSEVVAFVNQSQMFYSPTGGLTWFEVPVEPLAEQTITLHFNAHLRKLFAGTALDGVYMLDLGAMLQEVLP